MLALASHYATTYRNQRGRVLNLAVIRADLPEAIEAHATLFVPPGRRN